MATNFPGNTDDLNMVTTNPDVVPLAQADIAGGSATRAHTQHHRDVGDAIVALQNLVARHDHDHSGDNPDTNKPGIRRGSKLKQVNTHEEADTDTGASAIHHTLGFNTYQAAPGGNTHTWLTSHDEQIQLLRDLTQHSAFRVFDTSAQLTTWKNNASPTELSPSRQTVAYVKETDSFYLLVSSSSPEIPILAGLPVGSIFMFAGGGAPAHALRCDGGSHLRSAYPILSDVLGSTYGGTATHFNVPNLSGRVPVGRNTADSSFSLRGKTGGAKTHTHTEGDLRAAIGASGDQPEVLSYEANHVTPRGPKTVARYSVKGTLLNYNTRAFNHHTGVYGTTDSASTLQPYLVVDYYIVAR